MHVLFLRIRIILCATFMIVLSGCASNTTSASSNLKSVQVFDKNLRSNYIFEDRKNRQETSSD